MCFMVLAHGGLQYFYTADSSSARYTFLPNTGTSKLSHGVITRSFSLKEILKNSSLITQLAPI
jgi:hypothetical protein